MLDKHDLMIKEEYIETSANLKALRKRYLEKGREYFLADARQLFDEYEDLTSFGWTQYTPFFNDGDTCYFSANTQDPFINSKYPDWEEEEDDEGESIGITKERYSELADKVAVFLQSYEEDDLKDVFGDHSKIVVNSDGNVDIDSYDHD